MHSTTTIIAIIIIIIIIIIILDLNPGSCLAKGSYSPVCHHVSPVFK